jgi:hypothetical protein
LAIQYFSQLKTRRVGLKFYCRVHGIMNSSTGHLAEQPFPGCILRRDMHVHTNLEIAPNEAFPWRFTMHIIIT